MIERRTNELVSDFFNQITSKGLISSRSSALCAHVWVLSVEQSAGCFLKRVRCLGSTKEEIHVRGDINVRHHVQLTARYLYTRAERTYIAARETIHFFHDIRH